MNNSLATIPLDVGKKLEFNIEVQGLDPSEITEVNLVIIKSKFNISLPCKFVKSVLSIDFPSLLNVIPPGKYKFKLEFIVGNNYYVGLENTLNFSEPIKLNKMEVKKHQAPKIALTMVNPISEEVAEEIEEYEDEVEEYIEDEYIEEIIPSVVFKPIEEQHKPVKVETKISIAARNILNQARNAVKNNFNK